MTNYTVNIPDVGGADDLEVIEMLVAVGDTVSVDQSLLVLESDKASMEVPSPVAGIVKRLLVSNGDTLAEGSPIVELDVEAESESEATETRAESSEPAPPKAEQASAASTKEPVSDAEAQAKKSSAVAESSAMAVQPVLLPDVGGDGAEVIELSVKVGDSLSEGDTIAVLETDKASVEVPCPMAGTVKALHISEGQSVSTGDLLLDLESSASLAPVAPGVENDAAPEVQSAPEASESASASGNAAIKEPTQPSEPAQSLRSDGESLSQGYVYAGPAVRKIAREFGVELSKVKGSGPKGRILKEDVQNFVKQGLQNADLAQSNTGPAIAQIPEIDFAAFGPVRVEAMSRMHKLTAANMHRSWLNVPHVTQFDEADITDLEAFRQSLKGEMASRDVKLSPLPFVFKAVAVALMRHPKLNASLHADGENVVYKEYCHVGMAVDTDAGLLVPVIRDVDKKSVWELGAEILDIAARAKKRKLTPAEMQGGCFTVSSLGGIGGQGFTPIVNAPEVGILGVSKMSVKPVYDGEQFQPRKMLPVSLSYDHRAVNGGDAGRFLTELVGLLSDIRRQIM